MLLNFTSQIQNVINKNSCQAWLFLPVILAFERLRQENFESEVNLGYTVRLYLLSLYAKDHIYHGCLSVYWYFSIY